MYVYVCAGTFCFFCFLFFIFYINFQSSSFQSYLQPQYWCLQILSILGCIKSTYIWTFPSSMQISDLSALLYFLLYLHLFLLSTSRITFFFITCFLFFLWVYASFFPPLNLLVNLFLSQQISGESGRKCCVKFAVIIKTDLFYLEKFSPRLSYSLHLLSFNSFLITQVLKINYPTFTDTMF